MSKNQLAATRRANLKYLIEVRLPGGQTELSGLTGFSLSQIGQWLMVDGPNARNMGEKSARRIEDKCGLPHLWMDLSHTSEDDSGFSLLDKQTGIVTIPRYETGGSMGDGIVLHDQPGVIESWRVTKEWLASNVRGYTSATNLCIVTGFGDSMRPTYNPGDPLIVDKGITTVEFDSVYFFRVGNHGYVKRLQRIPTVEGLILKALSDNRDLYDPFEITPDMDFAVLGRVVQVWRREDY